jgi:hypothetical protein
MQKKVTNSLSKSTQLKEFDQTLRKALTDLSKSIPTDLEDIEYFHQNLFGIFEYRLTSDVEIDNKYDAWRASLGKPTSNYKLSPGHWVFRQYERGAIYWNSEAGVHVVEGPIYKKYVELGAHRGFLGYPLTDRIATAKSPLYRIGAYNDFQNGSIYWHPSIGAFEIHGLIRDKWRALGAQEFGFPLTDEMETPDGLGRFNHLRRFETHHQTADLSIYWSPATGAHEIHGAIRDKWASLGWETSYLGYPLTDEIDWTDLRDHSSGRVSRFQGGSISFWYNTLTTADLPLTVTLRAYPLNFPGPITGWAEFTFNSAGFYFYKGHIHDSSVFGFHVRVVSALRCQLADGTVLMTGEWKQIGGLEDHDWGKGGFDWRIRENFETLRYCGMETVTSVSMDIEDLGQSLLKMWPEILGVAVVAVIGWLFLTGKVKACPPITYLERDPLTGEEKVRQASPIVFGDEPCPPQPIGR